MVYDRAADKANTYQAGTPGNDIAATNEYAYLGFGIQNATNYYYSGDVRDIVVFERTLTDAEIAILDAYFKAKNQNTLKDMSATVEAGFESFLAENMENIHSFEYSSDASSHTAVCKTCFYTLTEDHTFNYSTKDEGYHVKSCSVCSFECEEPHSFSESDSIYKCISCNAESQLDKKPGGVTVIYVAVALALAGLGATAVAVIIKKKRNGK
jgi:Zn-finger protein